MATRSNTASAIGVNTAHRIVTRFAQAETSSSQPITGAYHSASTSCA
jgi:hypothetical protein